MIKKNKFKNFLILILFVLIVSSIFILKYTIADDLTQPVLINENDDLIYYLNVKYDGIDSYGGNSLLSNDDYLVTDLKSDYIYVEDKIPDGLIFDGFVTTSNGSIGAYNYIDEYYLEYCQGNVYDDTHEESTTTGKWNNDHTEYTYHGLHYNSTTRTVSFIVENLASGCNLSVGIKTKTPLLSLYSNVDRIDFYNYFRQRENMKSSFSNTVHNYIGNETSTLHNVTYNYSGIPDTNTSILPSNTQYSKNTSVGLPIPAFIEGYKFLRWESSDVTISDNSFIMPDSDVSITGVYEESNKYNVKYVINGDIPDDYYIPKEKSYYSYDTITLDNLESGDIVNGYKFLGWETNDVDVRNSNLTTGFSANSDFIKTSKKFTMPEKNVTFTGRFEKITYKLIYKFNDEVLPPNSSSYLPDTEIHNAGDSISLANISDVSGFKFLGWNKETTFKMPEQDVIVYGTWKEFLGYIQPSLEISTPDYIDYYKPGDIINFRGIITNTSSTPIKNIEVTGSRNSITDKNLAYFYEDEIEPGETGEFYITYILDENISNFDNYPSLLNFDFKIEYASSVDETLYDFKQSNQVASSYIRIAPKLKVCQEIEGIDVGNIFQYKIAEESGYETGFFLEKNKCVNIYLEPGTYNLKQITPQEYDIDSISGIISSNNEQFTMTYLVNSEVTYKNKFVKKKFMHSFGRIFNIINKRINNPGGNETILQ